MQIRDFTGVDFEPLARLLGRTWHAHHGDHSFWQGADELCDHLSQTDRGLVAQDDAGVPCGAILLASPNPADHNETLRMHWLQQRTRLSAMASALGVDARADVTWLNDERELMQRASDSRGSDGTGEVILLIVSEGMRGKGVGTQLMSEGLLWLGQHGATAARLVTDDGCDWRFYEHMGMERVAEGKATLDPACGMYVYQTALG